MTRREKSDAQLDAEAAAPRTPATPRRTHDHDPVRPRTSGRDLDTLIELHRQMRRDDAYIERLVARQPPSSRDPNTGVVHQHEATAVGMNMSARLYRYVESAPPLEYPWNAAFHRLRHWCRTQHPTHRGPHVPYWRGSLCQEAVQLVIKGPEKMLPSLPQRPLTAEEASEVLRYRLAPVLRMALGYIEASIDDARARAERRAVSYEDIHPASTQRHDQPGEHRRDCPRCRKEAA